MKYKRNKRHYINGFLFIEHHRFMFYKVYGFWLPPEFDIHHVDGNVKNDDPNNWCVCTRSRHTAMHNKILVKTGLKRCCQCKQEKSMEDFQKDKSRYDGINSKCRFCNNLNYHNTKERMTSYV